MRTVARGFCEFGRVAGLLGVLGVLPAQAQTAAPADNLIEKLSGADAPADIDVPALRAQVAERLKSKTDQVPLRRPPVAPQLSKLPQVSFEIKFDPDSPIVRPESYATLGRIADALGNPALLSTAFLVVDHINSGGRRDFNLTLTQRRADAVRDILSTTFKISSKRIHSLGLGEEQMLDATRPPALSNLRLQIIAVGKYQPPVAAPPAPDTKKGAPPPRAKGGSHHAR
jgi:outer membrane protein OmpA-like peptidoglycan-associated protein